MKIFCTKWCLTNGIQELYGEPVGNDMIQIGSCSYLHGQGKDWHLKKESAVKRALIMREKKIESLEKSITKLKKMTFE